MCKIQNMIIVSIKPVLTFVETTKFVFRHIWYKKYGIKEISMVCTRKKGVPVKM